MHAQSRAGAMSPAGGARAAPSLLLSLLLGASAPLWLRAEKLGESGGRAGSGSGVHGSPRGPPCAGGERGGCPRLVALRERSLSCSQGCI